MRGPHDLRRTLSATHFQDTMTLKNSTLLFAALVASPLLLALDLRVDAIAFGPDAGTSVERELSMSGAMYIDDLQFNMDGEEIPAEMLGDVLDTALEVEFTESVTDQFVKSGGGRPLVLLRTFNEITVMFSAAGETQEPEDAELVDSTVKFTWNDEDEEYEVSYEGEDGDGEELAGLDVDMDFTYLLPGDDVKVGASWEVTGEEGFKLLLPGGVSGGAEDVPEEATEFLELVQEIIDAQLEEALEEFTVDCTYEGKDDDGNALVAFEFEGEISLDLSELVMAAIDMQDLGGMEFDADISLTVDLELEGTGVLTWDTEAGHARGFEMAVEVIILLDAVADIEVAGESHSGEGAIELSGEFEYEMSVE